MKKYALCILALLIASVMVSFKSDNVVMRMSDNATLTIKAVDGHLTFRKADNCTHIWPDFGWEYYGIYDDTVATSETNVVVYKQADTATICDMFFSISKDTSSMVFTQHQVIDFVKNYRHWLGKQNFFLTKSHGKYLFAWVCKSRTKSFGPGFNICFMPLTDDAMKTYRWKKEEGVHFIVPASK